MISAPMKKPIITAMLGLILLSFGCTRVSNRLALAKLQARLTEKYHENINVNLQNPRFLAITFVNSKLNQQDAIRRGQRAQETAVFVRSIYPSIDRIESLSVAYVESKTLLIFFHPSRSLEKFVFDKSGMTMFSGRTGEADARTPLTTFNAQRNETDVGIRRLQLDGDLNHGTALVPHFTVRGNVYDSNSKSSPPAWVSLDFACYADRRAFSGDQKLEVDGDGQLVFAGDAHLLSAQGPRNDDGNAQFLTAQIPFPQFSKVANARSVEIILGRKEFELSTVDIKALHEMSAYASEAGEMVSGR